MTTGNLELMSSSQDEGKAAKDVKDGAGKKPHDPEWTNSLKKLYNSVVDEPLPDSFKNLLSKLDEDEGK